MGLRANELAERLTSFNNDVVLFVEGCSAENWQKVCAWEQWSVGTTARHIGAGHFSAVELARMIVNGARLPHLTMDEIVKMANRDAKDHETCTRDEVLEILSRNGKTMVDFVKGLKDSDLDRTGYLSLSDKEISVQQLIESIILQSGGQHFKNIGIAIGA
jgi:hypothetical protein